MDATTQYVERFKVDSSIQCSVDIVNEPTQTDTAAVHQIIQTDELVADDSKVIPFRIEQIKQ